MTVEMTWDIPAIATQGDAAEAVRETAEAILEDIRSIWPVDTGESRDGWQLSLVDGRVSIRNAVNYVPYIRGGFPLAEAQLLFQANVGELELRLNGSEFVRMTEALKGKSLADILDLPATAGYRAGPRGAKDLAREQVPAAAEAIDVGP